MKTERLVLPGGAELDALIPEAAVPNDRDRIGLVICPGGGCWLPRIRRLRFCGTPGRTMMCPWKTRC